jgi:hypothetical protein
MIFDTWSRVRGLLLPAIAETNGTHNEDDVLIALLTGKCRLWASENAAVVTEIVVYPQMKILNCWLVGGDLARLRAMEPDLIAYARSMGCARVTGGGRAGWSRVRSDWSKGPTYMYKDI